jgi:hypothetical protein
MEWMHTIRASDDAEGQARLHAFVPTFREIVAALEAMQAEREAAKAAPAPAHEAAPASANVQALIAAAVQQALAAHPAPVAPSNGTAPLCPTHGAMKPSTKGKGWYCPAKLADGSWCNSR